MDCHSSTEEGNLSVAATQSAATVYRPLLSLFPDIIVVMN